MMVLPPFTGNKSQLIISGNLFNSPNHLADYVRSLKDSQPTNQPFTEKDDAFLREWISYHADAKQKIGSGIDCFLIKEHRDYGKLSRAIYIKRTDNTFVDVSYKEPSRALVQLKKTGILRRPERDTVTDFKNALRIAIEPQCLAIKRQAFLKVDKLICPVTGKLFAITEAETDHVYPVTFDALAWHWSLIWDVKPKEVELVDCGTYYKIADEQISASFAGFHLQAANLRVISKQANNSAPRFSVHWQTA